MIEPTDREFARELRNLEERLCAMVGRAAQQIALAMEALTTQDDELARRVIEADQIIDKDENEIDGLTMGILMARHQVASDLRFVTMALKFVVDIERIADLATNIAQRSLELNRLAAPDWRGDLTQLATLVEKNLHLVLDSFVRRDLDAAYAVIKADQEIDRLNSSLHALLIAHVATDAATVTRVLPLSAISRYLERMGDHVKNLAEEVMFMVSADDVRHRLASPAN